MFFLNNITITFPFAFLLFLILPFFWKFLRTIPLPPVLKKFPAIVLVAKEKSIDQTPAKLSYPIVILRLSIIIFLILAISQPVINQNNSSEKDYLIILDNSWVSGTSWTKKKNQIELFIKSRESVNNNYSVITTTEYAKEKTFRLFNKNSDEILEFIQSIKPLPWEANYSLIRNQFENTLNNYNSILWFTESIIDDEKEALYTKLKDFDLKIIYDKDSIIPPILDFNDDKNGYIKFKISHPLDIFKMGQINCYDLDKRLLYSLDYSENTIKKKNMHITEFKKKIPENIKDKIDFFQINDFKSPSSRFFLSEIHRTRVIGIHKNKFMREKSEFSSGNYYVKKALENKYKIIQQETEDLLKDNIRVIFVDDSFTIKSNLEPKLLTWIENGGTLIKFGGENLSINAKSQSINSFNDYFSLSGKIVNLDSKLSFKKALKINPADNSSPFYGVNISDEIEVKKYLQTKSNLLEKRLKIWLKLENGTPLISNLIFSKGQFIFFHIPCNNSWSNLSLTYTFIELLESIIGQVKGMQIKKDRLLKPYLNLNGVGEFEKPSAQTLNLKGFNEGDNIKIDYSHPPGLYKDSHGILGVNLGSYIDPNFRLFNYKESYSFEELSDKKRKELMPIFILISLFLFLLETIITLNKRQLIKFNFFNKNLFIFFILIFPNIILANNKSEKRNFSESHIGYILTGKDSIDAVNENGLSIISNLISKKTASIFGKPMAIDLKKDLLYPYPIIYWSINSRLKKISTTEKSKLETFINDGGLLLIDCKLNSYNIIFNECLNNLEKFFQSMQISSFKKLNNKNAISKSFYLIDSFPGRKNEDVFIAYTNSKNIDNAVSIIVGNNNWTEAWAKKKNGDYLYPLLDNIDNQRLISLRFGINLLVYTLTGNYKTDQVHIPEVLKRMER